MLTYKIKNIKTEAGEEIVFNDFYVSSDGNMISGTTDIYYDLIDGENIMVNNNINGLSQILSASVTTVRRQGWIDYLQEYPLLNKEFIIDYEGTQVILYYIMYDGQYYIQDTNYDENGNFTSNDTFTIPNIGTVKFDRKLKNVSILKKYYIENGIINIDDNLYIDSIDFNLNNLSNYDESSKMYYDYLMTDGLSYKIYYYDSKHYYDVYKCIISLEDNVIKLPLNNAYCAEKYRYVTYNNIDYNVSSRNDGSDMIYMNLPKYFIYNGDSAMTPIKYDTYEEALENAISSGYSSENIFSENENKTEIALSSRTYSDYFYNDDICPNFEEYYENDENLEGINNLFIKDAYSASTYAKGIYLITQNQYNNLTVMDEISYSSTTEIANELIVSPIYSASSYDNYIVWNGKKYMESAYSYFTVSIDNDEYELEISNENYSGKNIGYIIFNNTKTILLLNSNIPSALTSATRNVITSSGTFSEKTYIVNSYGTYTINGNSYVASKHNIGYNDYRAIDYSDYDYGKFSIDEIIGTNMFRCSPILSDSLSGEERDSEAISLCYNVYMNYSEFNFNVINRIFRSRNLSIDDYMGVVPSDEGYESLPQQVENELSIYKINNYFNIPITLNTDSSNNNYQEWTVNDNFVNDETYKNINSIIDMERDVYYPAKYADNNSCGIPQDLEIVKEIEFNFHFRTREMSGWTINVDNSGNSITSGVSNYFITDYPKYSATTNSGKYEKIAAVSDILGFLKFTDDDVFYQKNKLSKSFIRLEFYDSPDPKNQNMLYYSTVFVDENELYQKYLKGMNMVPTSIDEDSYHFLTTSDAILSSGTFYNSNGTVKSSIGVNTEPTQSELIDNAKNVIADTFDENYRLSSRITVKDRYQTHTSSDGFYLYIYKDYSTDMEERSIYMKVEYNHTGLGKIIPFMYPRKFTANNSEITDLTLNSAYINDKEYELYNYYTIKAWDDNNDMITYPINSNIEKDLSKIKHGYKLKDIYYQQYVELKVIYDAANRRYVYYLPFNDSTCYNNNKMVLNLWEIKINDD